jgi:hypothetical protein
MTLVSCTPSISKAISAQCLSQKSWCDNVVNLLFIFFGCARPSRLRATLEGQVRGGHSAEEKKTTTPNADHARKDLLLGHSDNNILLRVNITSYFDCTKTILHKFRLSLIPVQRLSLFSHYPPQVSKSWMKLSMNILLLFEFIAFSKFLR